MITKNDIIMSLIIWAPTISLVIAGSYTTTKANK